MGFISPAQLSAAMIEMHDTVSDGQHLDPEGEEFSHMFHAIDRNGDQRIEAHEFMVS